MNERILREAMLQVQARRTRAQLENERRYDEINRKIPPIAEINSRLAQTALRIMEIARTGGNTAERLEALRNENLEAQRLCAQLLESHGYPADYLDIRYTCEKCQDTGYSEGRYCDCLRKAAASAGIAQMNRNAQVSLSDFGQFSLDFYKGRTTEQGEDCYALMRRVFQKCQNYAAAFDADSSSMLFYGKTGLGKTHLSLAIAKAVIEKGYDVIYDSIINLLGQVEKEHFRREESDIDTLALLLNVNLLILDDLGTEFNTPFNVSTVYNIINTRLNRGLPTIISTNLEIQDIKRRYEERIVSRLYAVYDCLHFVGTDVRLLKKKMQ